MYSARTSPGHCQPSLVLGLSVLCSLLLSSCALLSPKTNDDRMASISGQALVVSVPASNLDLTRLQNSARSEQTIMALVTAPFYRQAFTTNGNRNGSKLVVDDPSRLIVNNLVDYYKKEYQSRIVAKGTINNIDPQHLAHAVQQGDFVIDVRVSDLALIGNADNQQFHLQASYQLVVVDRLQASYLIQDRCAFAEPGNQQMIRHFSDNNGQAVAEFLRKYAADCLRYFAQGTLFPAQLTTLKDTIKTVQTTSMEKAQIPASGKGTSYGWLGLNSSVALYQEPEPDGLTLFALSASYTVGKRLSEQMSLMVNTELNILQADSFPTFSTQAIYGASLGVGAAYHPNSRLDRGVALLATGTMGQFLQQGVNLSTSGLGFQLVAFRPLLGELQGTVRYGFTQHLGATTAANNGGHLFGFGLAYPS